MKKNLIYGLIFIVGLFIILSLTGVLKLPFAIGSQSGNVWCDNFNYVCCQAVNINSNPSISSKTTASCPATADHCTINGGGSGAYLYSGKTNCVITSILGFLPQLSCSDQVTLKSASSSGSFPININKGFYVFSDRDSSISLTVVNTRLASTGTSTDPQAGIPVPGSVSCGWDSSLGAPYSKSNFNALTFSYNVPVNDCVLQKAGTQFLCGNIFDQCNSDADCSGYPINGNQVCNSANNHLQTYKCLNMNGLPSGVSKDSTGKYTGQPTIGQEPDKYSGTGKVCTVDQTLDRTVGCCPGTSCGTNMFCNPKTFTCEKTTKCNIDSDCNTAPICDYVNLVNKKPFCNSGNCDFKTQSVGCCNDNNCAIDQTCNQLTNKCVAKPKIVSACLSACCVDDPATSGYALKSCPTGQYCQNNACVSTPGCKSDSDCLLTQECKSGECILKSQSCSNIFGGLVPTTGIVTSRDCGFLGLSCAFGSSGTVTTKCGYDWTAFIIGVFIVLIIGMFVVYFMRRKK